MRRLQDLGVKDLAGVPFAPGNLRLLDRYCKIQIVS